MDEWARVGRLSVVDPSSPTSSDAIDLSFEGTYRQHFPALMRVAYLMTGTNEVAEDLVHDVFVRCWNRLSTVEDQRSYLRASVVNACRRHHRREARFTDHPPTQAEQDPPTADAIAVRRALMAMTPKRRAAVVLRFYEDLTHDDIADALGCRPATARSLVRRGLDDLRGALHD